jgi:hypothetical protein
MSDVTDILHSISNYVQSDVIKKMVPAMEGDIPKSHLEETLLTEAALGLESTRSRLQIMASHAPVPENARKKI